MKNISEYNSGPTRMEIQKQYDALQKKYSSDRPRLNDLEDMFDIYDIKVSKGKIVSFKINEGIKESKITHYPSLKNLVKMSYTDPRVATEGTKIHVEKEGIFVQGDSVIEGSYIMYEDKGLPGKYIAVHVSNDVSEDSGEPTVNVIALDMNRKQVKERMAYRMRKSKGACNEVQIDEAVPKSDSYGFTKDGVLMYKGNKAKSLQLMKVEKKHDPDAKYQLVYSPNLPKPGNKYINEEQVMNEAPYGYLTTFARIKIGQKFEIPKDPSKAILQKVSKTHYIVVSKNHSASGTKNKMDDLNMRVLPA